MIFAFTEVIREMILPNQAVVLFFKPWVQSTPMPTRTFVATSSTWLALWTLVCQTRTKGPTLICHPGSGPVDIVFWASGQGVSISAGAFGQSSALWGSHMRFQPSRR